jgi:tetraacyldisaccharide 4'-kinase
MVTIANSSLENHYNSGRPSMKTQIESIMRSDHATGFFAFVLFVLSLIYSGIMKIRALLYQWGIFRIHKLPCKVISIGNISTGGAGKTPMTIYLAKMLTRMNFRVVILSRGYKGNYEQSCAIVSDGNKVFLDAQTAGDEPCLMAQKLSDVPVIVGKNRYECGVLANQQFSPDIILLDDAFQHLRIFRDLDIVLMDFHRPLGNTHVIPRGVLREPKSHLHRAHMFILTRASQNQEHFFQIKSFVRNKPIFKCNHVPDQLMQINEAGHLSFLPTETLANQSVYAFSGIANNEDFLKILTGLQYQIVSSENFDDHHDYTDNDLKTIDAKAKNAGAKYLVTTEKDYVKICNQIHWSFPLFALGIQLSFGNDTNQFESTIQNQVTTP